MARTFTRAPRKTPKSIASSGNDVALGFEGVGPLVERDYWAVIKRCRITPAEVIESVRRRFWAFAPKEFVEFQRTDGKVSTLEVGDEMLVHIRMAVTCSVRVVHSDAQTLTLATMVGHPEAGRITFGAYRDTQGAVIFHIRSHARSSSLWFALGYAAMGEAMQTATWADFIASVARTFGDGVTGAISAEARVLPELEAQQEDPCTPTFHAQGN